MPDVFSLELAIYFVLPPLLLFGAAFFSADIFVLIAQTVVERDIKRDTGVTAMAILIGATMSGSLIVYWVTQRLSVAIVSAPAISFAVGGIACGRLLQDHCYACTKQRFGPIGFRRGFVVSALLSACTIVPISVVAWFATQPK